jgi:hypothetical protein
MGMLYTENDLQRFIERQSGNVHFRVEALGRSRKGRGIERIRAGRLDGKARHRVLVTARHHACEMMASYALEGLLESVVGDEETGRWFRRNAELAAIPFVDKDGVEEGDQGKNRRPHDHNRDYGGESLYPSVAALRSWAPAWSEDRLRVTLDLHCPYIRGRHNDVIYIVGSPAPENWVQQQRFGELLETVRRGPLPYRASDNLPFGQAWNTQENYGKEVSSSQWFGGLSGVKLAATFELPYAEAGGAVVTPESARALGADLARALKAYLGGELSTSNHSERRK